MTDTELKQLIQDCGLAPRDVIFLQHDRAREPEKAQQELRDIWARCALTVDEYWRNGSPDGQKPQAILNARTGKISRIKD